jgi:hypothetical protein
MALALNIFLLKDTGALSNNRIPTKIDLVVFGMTCIVYAEPLLTVTYTWRSEGNKQKLLLFPKKGQF